jgi:hypothetical protein
MMYALTTTDNPFHPITEFKEWFEFDTRHGYHSLSLLARIARTSDNLSDSDNDSAVEQAIDEIVLENVSGVHIKVEA